MSSAEIWYLATARARRAVQRCGFTLKRPVEREWSVEDGVSSLAAFRHPAPGRPQQFPLGFRSTTAASLLAKSPAIAAAEAIAPGITRKPGPSRRSPLRAA